MNPLDLACYLRGRECTIQHELYYALRRRGFGVMPQLPLTCGVPDLSLFEVDGTFTHVIAFVECKGRGISVPPAQMKRYLAAGVPVFVCNQHSEIQNLVATVLRYSDSKEVKYVELASILAREL